MRRWIRVLRTPPGPPPALPPPAGLPAAPPPATGGPAGFAPGTRVRRPPLGLAAAVLTLAVLLLAVIAPILWTDDANAVDTRNILAGPAAAHWAGHDTQ